VSQLREAAVRCNLPCSICLRLRRERDKCIRYLFLLQSHSAAAWKNGKRIGSINEEWRIPKTRVTPSKRWSCASYDEIQIGKILLRGTLAEENSSRNFWRRFFFYSCFIWRWFVVIARLSCESRYRSNSGTDATACIVARVTWYKRNKYSYKDHKHEHDAIQLYRAIYPSNTRNRAFFLGTMIGIPSFSASALSNCRNNTRGS
jgi:hypothetical protein